MNRTEPHPIEVLLVACWLAVEAACHLLAALVALMLVLIPRTSKNSAPHWWPWPSPCSPGPGRAAEWTNGEHVPVLRECTDVGTLFLLSCRNLERSRRPVARPASQLHASRDSTPNCWHLSLASPPHSPRVAHAARLARSAVTRATTCSSPGSGIRCSSWRSRPTTVAGCIPVRFGLLRCRAPQGLHRFEVPNNRFDSQTSCSRPQEQRHSQERRARPVARRIVGPLISSQSFTRRPGCR